jgi:phospholipase D1/2
MLMTRAVGLIALGLLVALPAAWHWTPLGDWVDLAGLIASLKAIEHRPAAIVVILAAFPITGLVMLPTTVLVLATVLIFGPWLGSVYALLGCMLSAMLAYGLGRLVRRDRLPRLLGAPLSRVMDMLRGNELIAVAMVNWSQLVSLTLSGVAAGALRLHLGRYLAGTLLGTAPGVVVLAVIENRLEAAIRAPAPANLAMLVAVAALWALGMLWGSRQMMQAWRGMDRSGAGNGSGSGSLNAHRRASGDPRHPW